MSRTQTFVSNGTKKKIEAIVRQRNVDCSYLIDINLSNTTTMLVEFGIKTYNQERKNNGEKIERDKCNKLILEHVINTTLIMQYLVSNQPPGVIGIDRSDPRPIFAIISSRVKETVEAFHFEQMIRNHLARLSVLHSYASSIRLFV